MEQVPYEKWTHLCMTSSHHQVPDNMTRLTLKGYIDGELISSSKFEVYLLRNDILHSYMIVPSQLQCCWCGFS